MITSGEQIKINRKKAGLTQEQLAKKIGLSLMTIRRYEKNERIVPNAVLQKVADALGCSKWDLVERITPEEMYRRDIERYSNMPSVEFPQDSFRQHAVNRVSLAIANVDETGVQEIVDHAEFIEKKQQEKKKNEPVQK